MISEDRFSKGSLIAKNGFKNEQEVADKFNNWKVDLDAQKWLEIMKYDLNKIEYVRANKLTGGYKADINCKVQIKLKNALDIENIQVKLVSNKKGFNQIDKRWLKNYKELWQIPEDIFELLQYFTGEKAPYKITKDSRRMFLNEMTEKEKNNILKWFDDNKMLIISDILRGRGEFAAEWVLVAQKSEINARWVLKNINEVMNYYYGDGLVKMSPRGSINIGKIGIQRKGGDNGRATANMLQFKIDPIELFDLE